METSPQGTVHAVVEIPADADTYISSEKADHNFAVTNLYLGYNQEDNYGAERLLLHFDIANGIPANAVINSAQLRLYLYSSDPTDDDVMGMVIRRTNSHWTENAVTWNSEPEWGEIRVDDDVGSAVGWYEWDVKDLVSGWYDGSYNNYGVEIIGDEHVQQRERAFYSRESPTENFPRLKVDYTVYDDDEPPIITIDPLAGYSSANFTVSWSGEDRGTSGIAYYDIQYRVDGGDWLDWFLHVTFTSAEFSGENGKFYEFRARGVDNAGNVEAFGDPEAHTTVDTAPPNSWAQPLATFMNIAQFIVNWYGDDHGGSGIRHYDVQYRFNGGSWVLWQQQTIGVSATFTADADGLYEFEVRAVDNIGFQETFINHAEAATTIDRAPPKVTVQTLPSYVPANFTVAWSGADAGLAGIQYYDVQYRVSTGSWANWYTGIISTTADFIGGVNGTRYQFRARGVDNANNIEAFGDFEAQTVVDTQPPMARVAALPTIAKGESFTISWSGDDSGGSGIQYYDVQYKFGGDWTLWQQHTTATSATFTTTEDGIYKFEARAVDNVNLVESFANQAEAFTIVDARPPFMEPRLWLPIIMK